MQRPFEVQRELFVSAVDLDHPALCELDGAEAVLDWHKLEGLMSCIYASTSGRSSYPSLTLFRALLLGIWYGLSDVALSKSLARDLLFRKFCRLELGHGTPDDSTLCRFRDELAKADLWEVLMGEVHEQLESQHIIMTQGRINIVDATPIEAAQSGSGTRKDGTPKRDADADWHVKANSRGHKTSTYGYSVHVGVDEDGFIHRTTVTPGNVHDSQERDTLLLGDEAQFYGDAAYSSQETQQKLARHGIEDKVQRKAYRNHPLSQEDKMRNAEIAVTRSGGERPFATYKRHYGLARTRLMGLAKNLNFFGIVAIAYNIKKAAKFLQLYGQRKPHYAG
jgi:transposase, IS5 family